MLDTMLYLIWTLIKILAIAVPLITAVAFYTYFERKVIGAMQIRVGPSRVGPYGLIQPFADVFKLLLKRLAVDGPPSKPRISHPKLVWGWSSQPFTSLTSCGVEAQM